MHGHEGDLLVCSVTDTGTCRMTRRINVYPSRWLALGAGPTPVLAPGRGSRTAKAGGRIAGTHRQEAQLAAAPGLQPHGSCQVDLHQRARWDFLLCTFSQVHSAQGHVDI